ncbi:hypothetical protein SGLAM104S_01648 [Streptomyces glaucescens]
MHTSADRRLAAEHWLAATHPNAAQVRWEWQHRGLALLPLGGLFCAVRLPDHLVRAVAARARKDPAVYLMEELRGGPVIRNPRHEQYHALVPRSMPEEWAGAVAEWPTWAPSAWAAAPTWVYRLSTRWRTPLAARRTGPCRCRPLVSCATRSTWPRWSPPGPGTWTARPPRHHPKLLPPVRACLWLPATKVGSARQIE